MNYFLKFNLLAFALYVCLFVGNYRIVFLLYQLYQYTSQFGYIALLYSNMAFHFNRN
jgi:hypothetical protein